MIQNPWDMLLYYSCVVLLQGKRRTGTDKAVFYHSFLSGCIAGCTASFAVNPADGKLLFISISPSFKLLNLKHELLIIYKYPLEYSITFYK